MKVYETDVLVVGAGPTGLTAAALLARQEVSAITIGKHRSTANGPRAHVTNQRTMEVMRDLRIEQQIYDAGYTMDKTPSVVWTTTLGGREIARRLAWGTRPDRKGDYEASSPTQMANVPQLFLEPVLLNRAVSLGADVRFNTELIDICQDHDGVTAVVVYRPTGERYTIRAQYAIGADGGRSTVASQTGFSFEGRGTLGYGLNAYIEADLEHLVAHRPADLYWTNRPGKAYFHGSGAFALVHKWNQWLVQFSYDPTEDPMSANEGEVVSRIRDCIGDSRVPIKIKGVGTWELQDRVATSYRSGRIFIAGDAAHRHTPANGLGLNTSVQDAYNISWKLATVVRERGNDGLLDSYEAERLPVGRQVVARATKSAGLVSALPTSLGIVSGQTEKEGQSALDSYFAPTPEGRDRRNDVQMALKNWDYGLHCHGVEMAQRYTHGALIDDGTLWREPVRDPELYYEPTSHPGSKVPHAWIEHNKKLISTLDLVPDDGWLIITGSTGQPWAVAAEEVSLDLRVPLACVIVGPGLEYSDVYGDWTTLREVTEGGALLVRPDRHVALRVFDAVADPAQTLRTALTEVLFPIVNSCD